MAKDKRIADLPGISQANIVALSRMGLLTATDLINADFDRISVVIEDFNEAARLVKEARRSSEPRKKNEAPASPASPGTIAIPVPRTAARSSTPVAGQRPSSTMRTNHTSQTNHSGQSNQSGPAGALSRALAIAAGSVGEGPDWKRHLSRRLEAARLLLENDGSADEVAASLLLEGYENGSLREDDSLGQELSSLLEECVALRAVPVLPTGALPRYYLQMASAASTAARRVCAAELLAGGDDRGRADLLAAALLEGEEDPLVSRVADLPKTIRRAA